MKSTSFRKILYILSVFSVVMTTAAILTLPWLVRWYAKNIVFVTIPFSVTVFIYLTLFPFLTILIAVVKLSRNLMKNNPFSQNSLDQLRAISICSALDCLLYIIGVFFYRNLLCIVVLAGTIMVFLISSVVRELITNGIRIKEENDLTI